MSIEKRLGITKPLMNFFDHAWLIFVDSLIIKFIRNAKELGFSLREISELLALEADTEDGRKETREKTEAKIAEIDGRIASLQGLKRHLEELVETCRSGRRECRCPIMDTMKQGLREGSSRSRERKE